MLKTEEQNLTPASSYKIVPDYYFLKLFLLSVIFIVVIFWSVISGSSNIEYQDLIYYFTGQSNLLKEEVIYIIGDIRIPRIITGILAGLSLAVSGMILQAVFRNPLVDPFITGVSGGASLGAGIAILFNLNFYYYGISSVQLIAFLFSAIAIFSCYIISLNKGIMNTERLLLAGISISSLSSALLSLLMVLKGQDSNAVTFWIMGNLSGKSWENIKVILPYIVITIIFILFKLHKMNILQLGEETAENLGTNINYEKILLILSASLLAAVIVSISGMIGFVGLVVPQITKLFIKTYDYRFLFPAVLVSGPIIMVSADTFSRTVLSPQEIPVGVFTALLGVPFFLFLLKSNSTFKSF